MGVVTIGHASEHGEFTYRLDLEDRYNNERTILNALRAGQVPEMEVLRTARMILRDGDSVLDVGANIGGMTIPFAKMVGGTGRVIAAEPDPHNLDRLRSNLSLNADIEPVVRVVPAPVGAACEEVVFHFNADDSGGNALWDPGVFPGNQASADAPRQQRMTATTVDALMETLSAEGRSLRLLKVDTEGAEYLVLSGAKATLHPTRIPFILAELHDFGLAQLGHSEAMLREMMRRRGYDMFDLGDGESPPRLVSHGEQIESAYIPNVLFAAEADVEVVWGS